jgi:serine/threonine protein kinase
VKIIDFGSAIIEDMALPPAHYTQFRGTMSYAGPEILGKHAHRAGPCDIWSLGVILGILLTGESPFPDKSYARAGKMRFKRPISPLAYELMGGCFVVDPKARWGIEKIKGHRWFDETFGNKWRVY